MFNRIADNRNENSLATQMRRKRFAFFESLLSQLEPPIRILDIGGTESYWKMMLQSTNDQVSITLLNLEPVTVTMPNMVSVLGDARNIQLADQSFDVVFSNSVIEHVGNYEDQRQMAREVMRLGKCYFVQTPNKYFPIEPHFLFPFFQFLPVGVRVRLLQNFRLGWMPKTPDKQEAKTVVESIRLLDHSQFAALFPTATVYKEKIFGLTKSFVVYAGWNDIH